MRIFPIPRRAKQYIQNIFIALGTMVTLFAILNAPFFWKNFLYSIHGPAPVTTQPISNIVPHEKMLPNTIIISSLGIQAPIIYIDVIKEEVFQAALIHGIVHYPNTASIGAFGNCYVFGHSSDFWWSKGKYKTVFALLPKIQKGAEINASDKNGNAFTYIVTDTKVISSTDVQYLSQMGNKKRLLTLQTSYPVGTALKRFIAIAEIK